MPGSTMMVACGIEEDEDGQYLSINDQRNNTRIRFVESGEEASNGFTHALSARAFGARGDTIKVVICDTLDPRAGSQIYVVPKEDVFPKSEFMESMDH
jgi:hypothetical protein